MKTQYKFFCFCISFWIIGGFSCSEQVEQQSISTEQTSEENVEITPEPDLQKTHVLMITHKVEDFKVWEKGFNEHESARQAFGMDMLNVFRSIEDSNTVTIMMMIGDMEIARQYVLSTGLKEIMKKHGVVGKPETRFLSTVQKVVRSGKGNCLLVSHQVSDFEQWQKGFETFKQERHNYGLETLNIFRSIKNPGYVTIMFAIIDMQSAMYYAGSTQIDEKLKSHGGVTGDLEVNFVMAVIK